jgi:Protein of unknown function (DUF3558)
MPCLIALLLATVLLAACGGSSKPSPPPGSPQNPLVAQTEKSNPASEAGRPASAGPGYQGLVESQASKPRSRFTPCNLVTKEQAQAIVGLPLRDPLEAPRGPTCIYRSRDGKHLVTLAVQPLDFAKLKRRVHGRQAVSVANRSAFCGTLGAPVLYVELPGRRVLSVAAGCEVGKRFATAAVRRLDT